jgi:hypothetical protein
MVTPDLTQKVIGFRQWAIRDGLLWPVGSYGRDAWEPGPQRAYCARSTHINGHSVPDPCIPVVSPWCECGFYALHSLSEAHWGGDNIRGIVLGWGRMAMHNQGWRAQFVELVALIYPQHATKGDKEVVDSLAKAYGVPTVEWERAESYAKEFGDYCPNSLKPRSWTIEELEADRKNEMTWTEVKQRMNAAISALLPRELREDKMVMDKVLDLIKEAISMVDPEVPEAYAALHNIYVPTTGELLEGLINGITVEYVPEPEVPQAAEIKIGRNFELSISTNATVLWLPLQAPGRHQ